MVHSLALPASSSSRDFANPGSTSSHSAGSCPGERKRRCGLAVDEQRVGDSHVAAVDLAREQAVPRGVHGLVPGTTTGARQVPGDLETDRAVVRKQRRSQRPLRRGPQRRRIATAAAGRHGRGDRGGGELCRQGLRGRPEEEPGGRGRLPRRRQGVHRLKI